MAFPAFLGEGLHGVHRVQRFLAMAGKITDPVLGLARQHAHLAPDHHDRHDHQRHHHQDQKRQLQIGDEQQHQATDQKEDIAQRLGQGRADDALHDGGVGGQPGQHLAGARHLEKAWGQANDVAVDVLSEIGDQSFAEPRHQKSAREGGKRQNGHDQKSGFQRMIQRFRFALAKSAVDQIAKTGAEGENRCRRQHQSATSVKATCSL